jgi:hypothetical protein
MIKALTTAAPPKKVEGVYVDPETEAMILAAIIQKVPRVYSSGLVSQIEDWHLTAEPYQWYIRTFKGEVPLKVRLKEEIENSLTDKDAKERHWIALERLYDLQLPEMDQVVSTFKGYIAFQTASVGVRKFYEDFGRTRRVDFALDDLRKTVQRSKNLIEQEGISTFDFAKGWHAREEERKYLRDNPDLKPRLRLGVPKFDNQVKMEAGGVYNFLAPMKRYKSVILASLAYSSLLQGYNTALVVLENTPQLTMDRLDSMFTQLNYERLVSFLKTKKEKEYADQLMDRINKWPQRLKIIKGEPNKTGTLEVEQELAVLNSEEGFVAEVKIYDYLNIMKPSTGAADDHLGQTQLVWDLQAVAKAKGQECVVVTASQANTGGLELDKNGKPIKIQVSHQGKSIGISQAVDATIAINLDPGPIDEGGLVAPPQIILSILFLRNGKVSIPDVKLVSEIDRMCMDRSQRHLWEEAVEFDGIQPSAPPV